MKKLESRYYKALAVATAIHILAAGILGVYAWMPSTVNDKVIEVTLAGAPKKKGVKKPVVTPNKPKPKPVKIKPKKDDIVDKRLVEEKQPEVETTETYEPEPTSTESGEQGDPEGVENGSETGNGGQEGVAVKLPYVTYKVEPNYPNECRVNKQEGVTTLRIMVGDNGRTLEAQVVGSSGFAPLDEAALKAVYKWRFSPAKNAQGKAIKCYVTFPIIFKLK